MSLVSRLKRHPFPVVAQFDQVVALSFAFPEPLLNALIPEGLEMDSYQGFGFVTVALVWTRHLRPAFLPRAFGRDFFMAGYRVFTRLKNEDGRRLRGLKILRSETDKASMVSMGNLMTHYGYRLIDLEMNEEDIGTRVTTRLPCGKVTLDVLLDLDEVPSLPPDGSPFADWRAARQYAGPMPFTFDAESDGRFVVIEGKRSDWTPMAVSVRHWEVSLFDEVPFKGVTPILANAFRVENVPYRWERGRLIKPWKQP